MTDVSGAIVGLFPAISVKVRRTKPNLWNESYLTRLAKLWSEGYSAGQIAKEFGEGFTRNAIAGKVHRLNLPTRDSRPRLPPQPKPKRKPNPELARLIRAKERKQQQVMEPVVTLPPDKSDCPVSFFDAKRSQCKFPLWGDETPMMDRQYCGSAVCQRNGPFGDIVDTSYCLRHFRIVYRRAPAAVSAAERQRRQQLGRKNLAEGRFR